MLDHDFWTGSLVIRTRSWALRRKSDLELMSEQFEEIEKDVQNASMWSRNDLFEGLCRRLWDREAPFCDPSPPHGEFYNFRSTILEVFLVSFLYILDITLASINWTGFWCVLGIDFCCKREGCCYQFETRTRWYYDISCYMCKVDFGTIVFWRFSLFSSIRSRDRDYFWAHIVRAWVEVTTPKMTFGRWVWGDPGRE